MRLPASLGLVVVAGVLHAVSIAAPWDGQPYGSLQLLALSVLAWQLMAQRNAVRAAWLGWGFATAWLAGTFWWLFIAMHTYAGLPAWLSALAVLALAAALAGYYALACMACAAWMPANRVAAATLFAALWMLAELARGVWFTGFGWGAAGYAHIDGLARSARFVGAYGVAALVAWIAFLLADGLRNMRSLRGVGALGLAGIAAAIMGWSPGGFTTSSGTIKVALLQGNIAQDEKFQAGTGVADALRWYGEQLGAAAAPLVIAPETAIPVLPQQLPDGYWVGLQQRFKTGHAALMGIPLGNPADGYSNSVVGLTNAGGLAMDGSSYRYDKHHLVPFGEFIPPFFRWFTEMMDIPLGDFNRGAVGQPSFLWQGQRLAPNVCYEDLFGEELGARFLTPDRAPTIFVNVSNIAWFGNSVAIDQHLHISRMRALEFDRPFIRATNTGDTAIIDHHGRVTHALPRLTRGVLVGDVQGRDGVTPFAWWVSRWGLWPLWMLGTSTVLFYFLQQRRRSRSAPRATT